MALVRCIHPFVTDDNGVETLVAEGEVFDADHRFVKRTPDEWWEVLVVHGAVEEATAAPGKKRTTRTEG